ncbi:MAG TPA: M28 family peptidase [Ignavibacteriales bacterium]|nr:M28 family peptidase [Ignavibacteriales bacterium]
MKKILLYSFFYAFSAFSTMNCQVNDTWSKLTGSAFLENRSYEAFQNICDLAGGRLLGSKANEKAMEILLEELKTIGITAYKENFKVPGWVRGDDEVLINSPLQRKLQAIALGYVNSHPAFTLGVVYAGSGFNDDYSSLEAKDKIVLVSSEAPKGKEPILRYEAIDIATSHGAKAILFINDRQGMYNLAGTGNFQGTQAPIPAYSLTYEEGMWLKRLCTEGKDPQVKITTRSYCKEVETSNIVFSLPGKVKDKIVVGAHFDSWDISQGAVDNGQGSAILFDVARLMKTFSPDNYYSIDFVWFNGEELGLWGSKRYAAMHSGEPIAAMINMDMTGSPKGFNCMGFDEFKPFFERLKNELNGFDLSSGVASVPYTNSDHIPFMFKGIPTFSIMGHLEEESVKYYHTSGDNFDKISKKQLSEASAVVSIMLHELANYEKLSSGHKDSRQMADLFRKFHLDERLKRQKEWIYSN